MTDANPVPHLATVKRTAVLFADAELTELAIRQHIFKAEDRLNSRGEKIKGNGLAETGAIVRCGSKILLNVPKYGAWLAGEAPEAQPAKTPTASPAPHTEAVGTTGKRKRVT